MQWSGSKRSAGRMPKDSSSRSTLGINIPSVVTVRPQVPFTQRTARVYSRFSDTFDPQHLPTVKKVISAVSSSTLARAL